MSIDMTKFKSTYPDGYKTPLRKSTDDTQYRKASTIDPIGLIDVFSEKKEVIKEIRKPNKMATLGEMLRIWDHVNVDLYNELIERRYLNA
jgi:hypothetical protein